MNPRGRSLDPRPAPVSGSDRAVANLLRLLAIYIDGELCSDCEPQVSAAVCGQLERIAQSSRVSPAIRESCFDMLDHWLNPPERRVRFNTADAADAGRKC